MIVFNKNGIDKYFNSNKKELPLPSKISTHQGFRKTPSLKRKITKENKKFLKLLKILK